MLTMLKRSRERDRHLKTGGEWRDLSHQGTYVGSREMDGYPASSSASSDWAASAPASPSS